MILSAEERAELAKAMDEAWQGTSTTGVAVGQLRSILADAQQAHEKWAALVINDAIDAGLAQILKRHRTASKPAVTTKKGAVPRVVGARSKGAGGTEWEQLELEGLSRDQLADQIQIRRTQRSASDRVLVALLRIDSLFAKYPKATTVARALALEGVSLDDWLAA